MTCRQQGTLLTVEQTLIAASAKLQLKIAQGLDIRAIHQRIHKLKQTGNIRLALRLVQTPQTRQMRVLLEIRQRLRAHAAGRGVCREVYPG